MNRAGWAVLGFAAGLGAVAAAILLLTIDQGVSARGTPSGVEVWVARQVRHLAIPGHARALRNPVVDTPETLAMGRAHWADHCASCHGNDGRGDTSIGRGLYPKAPDMRQRATQDLSDGELFYIIENGIRFTGMPGWGGGGPADDPQTWHLVRFIRHLPALSSAEVAEMEHLNPKTPAELADEDETRQFLDAGSDPGEADGAVSPVDGGEAGEAPPDGEANPD